MSFVSEFLVSSAALVAANLIPLVGVAFFGWTLFSVMFLYWLESAIVGFFNILKMAKAQGTGASNFEINHTPADRFSRSGLIGFFIFHYGIFMTVHGVFIFALFGPPDMNPGAVAVAFALLAVSHGISYVSNFIMRRECLLVSPAQQISAPYRRIVLMHVTLLLAGFLAKAQKGTCGAIIFMVLLKIAMDLSLHLREHLKFRGAAPQGRADSGKETGPVPR